MKPTDPRYTWRRTAKLPKRVPAIIKKAAFEILRNDKDVTYKGYDTLMWADYSEDEQAYAVRQAKAIFTLMQL